MQRFALLPLVILAAADLFAARHVVFETDVFNRAFPLECRTDAVFSPLSAEIDFALTAESLDTIARANVAEMMGVLVEFGGVYRPLLERLETGTNGFSFVSARGFCLPQVRQARTDYRQQIQRDYGAEVMPLQPVKGAESWFRAAMDGQMEDFTLNAAVSRASAYSFYDLVSIRAEWAEPFPTSNVRRLTFAAADGTKAQLEFLTDVRMAETWLERTYAILKLPLRGGYSFYALLPNPDSDLARVREEFSSMEIESFLTRTGARPVGNYRHAPTVVVIPRFRLTSRVDLTGVMQFFRVPTSALVRLAKGTSPHEFVQRISFCLVEHGADEPPLASKPPEAQLKIQKDTRRLILNRPFLYFVYDEREGTIPLAGQFTGLREK